MAKPRRPGGRYRARRTKNGRQKEVRLCTDFAESERMIEKMRREDQPILASRATIAQLVPDWLRSKRGKVTEKQIELTTARARRHLVPLFGHHRPERIQRRHLDQYRSVLLDKDLSDATVNAVLAHFRNFLNWCAEDGEYLYRVPSFKGMLIPIQEREPDRLNEVQRPAIEALGGQLGAVCRFLRGTGLRWGEACLATSGDVHFIDDRPTLIVGKQTKSRKVRRVPLGFVWDEIADRGDRFVPYAAATAGHFNRMVRRATGLDYFHAHQLRHTFGCEWIEDGGDLWELKEVMGHADIKTTLRYARPSDRQNTLTAEQIHARRAERRRRVEEGAAPVMEGRS